MTKPLVFAAKPPWSAVTEVIKMQSAWFALVLAAGILAGCAAPFGPPLAASCTAIGCTAVQATVEYQ
jgi:hypothetical protein